MHWFRLSCYLWRTRVTVEVVMPQVNDRVIEGTVVRWLKEAGDDVARGEIIAEVQIDQATVDVESPAAGTLIDVLATPGGTVPVGQAIAYIGAPRETVAERATPAAPSGATTGSRPRVPGGEGTIPLGKMGQAIARRTQATMNEVPHFYLTVRIDMTDAVAYRRELNRTSGEAARVSLNDMLMKACALALQTHPVFNSTFEGDHLRVHPHINVGMAVAVPGGLLVPAVLECEHKSLLQIAEATKDLVKRTRTGTLRQEEYTGTFTVSNLGMFDVESFTAIVVAPQVAVLAVGAVRPEPAVIGGEVAIRQMMSATLSTDHRAANGAEAAQLASEIKRILEQPSLLAADG